MNILYLSLTPNMRIDDWSGWGTHMRGVIGGLRGAGHRVEVSVAGAGRRTGDGDSSEVDGRAPTPSRRHGFLRGGLRHLSRDLYELLSDRRAAPRLAALVREHRIDAIYERSAMMQLAGTRTAATLGRPHVLEVNTPLEERRDHHGFPLYRVGIARERRKLVLADQIVCVSSPLRRYLIELGAAPDRVQVIANAVDPDRFRITAAERAEVRSAWGLEDEHVAIGFVGRFGYWRGMAALVQALAEAMRAAPHLRGVLIGDGQRMPDVRQAVQELGIQDRVILTGAVDWRRVPASVAALDVGVLLSSPWYSSPLKLFEYGAAGLCVVAPRTEPITEVMTDENHGVLVTAGATSEMTAALVALAGDADRRHALARRFQERVLAEHTWARVAERVGELITRSERRRRPAGQQAS